ncbi:unnamed protein product [Porites evermanni]|uniref:Uncharacterized protein n=1 Tax=Porites evermanni TaxID=104178 RepID=A0ABN8M274_9CNID|nr:unnamed protein product [Porites evermanni]
MSLSFGGELEPFALTPSSTDVIIASLRTSTHSEPEVGFCILGHWFCPNFRTYRPYRSKHTWQYNFGEPKVHSEVLIYNEGCPNEDDETKYGKYKFMCPQRSVDYDQFYLALKKGSLV